MRNLNTIGLGAIMLGIGLIIGWAPLVAWLGYGTLPAATLTAALERKSVGMFGGIVARVPDGGLAILRRSDIARIDEATCRRDWECWGRRCHSVYVRFHCGFRLGLRDGRDAAGYLMLGGRVPGIFGAISGEQAHFSGEEPRFEDAATALCGLGLGCSAEVKASPVAPLPAPAAGCEGIRQSIRPMGDPCLDPADPARRMFRDCRDGFCAPAMVLLPTGSYRRGLSDEENARLLADEGRPASDDLHWGERPVHEVRIGYHLAMGRTEVARGDWNACVADGACRALRSGLDERDPSVPVDGVSWTEIVGSYLPWLNGKLGLSGEGAYRLPTDAEWEYGARAGTTTRYPGGDLLTTRQARFYLPEPALAGSYPANAFGLHDMTGNVAEWVQDCYATRGYAVVPRDGSAHEEADCTSRIRRDGGWQQLPWYMHASYRTWSSPTGQAWTGFRLARTLPAG